jgi:hypothetical protein
MESNEVFRKTDYIPIVGERRYHARVSEYERQHSHKPCNPDDREKDIKRAWAFGAYRVFALGTAIIVPILGLAKYFGAFDD